MWFGRMRHTHTAFFFSDLHIAHAKINQPVFHPSNPKESHTKRLTTQRAERLLHKSKNRLYAKIQREGRSMEP
jgi:hypothetical protein